jgi:hypothetical protein
MVDGDAIAEVVSILSPISEELKEKELPKSTTFC